MRGTCWVTGPTLIAEVCDCVQDHKDCCKTHTGLLEWSGHTVDPIHAWHYHGYPTVMRKHMLHVCVQVYMHAQHIVIWMGSNRPDHIWRWLGSHWDRISGKSRCNLCSLTMFVLVRKPHLTNLHIDIQLQSEQTFFTTRCKCTGRGLDVIIQIMYEDTC